MNSEFNIDCCLERLQFIRTMSPPAIVSKEIPDIEVRILSAKISLFGLNNNNIINQIQCADDLCGLCIDNFEINAK